MLGLLCFPLSLSVRTKNHRLIIDTPYSVVRTADTLKVQGCGSFLVSFQINATRYSKVFDARLELFHVKGEEHRRECPV